MVLKVGKCGVRSGNTFKVPNAKHLRQYQKESFLVRSHITNGERVTEGVDSYLAEDAVHSNSVPYSLNKKSRWALPQQIREDILHGDHTVEEFGIQLVERHKLCKQADCIGVYSTKSKFKRKRKGYLNEKSILNTKPATSKRRHQEQIRRGLPVSEDETETNDQTDEPDQIRYDVFYPCPPTSSITYTNPKFQTPANENGSKNKGGKQRHRHKVADIIEDSLEFMDRAFDDSEEENLSHDEEEAISHVERTTECLLEDILTHAINASKRVNGETSRKRHGSKGHVQKASVSKGHIVFEERDSAIDAHETVPGKTISSQVVARNTPEVIPVLVILPNEQVDPQNLKFSFGNNYIECDCFPRKFVIDISQTVTGQFCKPTYNRTQKNYINASIVFIHDVDNEINNPKESVYKIFLNTSYNQSQQSVKIETIFDYIETNVNEVIERTLFYTETLPYDAIEFNTDVSKASKAPPSTVEELAYWHTSSYKPNDEYLLQYFVNARCDGSTASESDFEVVSSFDSYYDEETANVTSPKDRLCSVCFELLGPNVSGTALLSCGHWFCDMCWTSHLQTKVNGGSVRLQCPEYNCDKLVDPGTALTLLKMKDIIKHARVCHDTKVEQTSTKKWCPNEQCGRVLDTVTDDVGFVQCECGRRVCFHCLQSAHWPAPCESANLYKKKLIASGIDSVNPVDSENIVSVHGKCCPHCKRFVEKQGGCPHMSCVCGRSFCWGCGRDYSSNTHRDCYHNGTNDKHNTTRKQIKPVDPFKLQNKQGWYAVALTHRLKQHPKCIRQLETKSKCLSKQLQKHMMKAEETGEILVLNFDVPHKSFVHGSSKIPDFLRNTIELYREINHVVENASVLLDANSSNKNRLHDVKHIVRRLSLFAEDIFDMFVHGARPNSGTPSVKSLLKKMIDVRYYSRITMQGLVKRIKMLEL